jgi:hypothetical protein
MQALLLIAEHGGPTTLAHIRTLNEQLDDTHCGVREIKQSESESIIAIRFVFQRISTRKFRNNTNCTANVQQRRFRDLTYGHEPGPLTSADAASREQSHIPDVRLRVL